MFGRIYQSTLVLVEEVERRPCPLFFLTWLTRTNYPQVMISQNGTILVFSESTCRWIIPYIIEIEFTMLDISIYFFFLLVVFFLFFFITTLLVSNLVTSIGVGFGSAEGVAGVVVDGVSVAFVDSLTSLAATSAVMEKLVSFPCCCCNFLIPLLSFFDSRFLLLLPFCG